MEEETRRNSRSEEPMTTPELICQLRAARPGYPPGELCMRAADEIERLAALVQFDVEAILEFGFASFQDRSFELIARNEAGNEITLKGKLEEQDLEQIDKIFPTCVFVKYALAALAQSDAGPNASAGLIEAERLTDTAARIINRLQHLIDLTAVQPKRVWRDIIVSEIETMLRSRAADRSGK